jgi:hypothetical protein
MRKSKHPVIGGHLSVPGENCYFRFQVTGDDESRLRQVEQETEKALMVLRFVTMWLSKTEGTRRIKYNPATYTSVREQGKRYVVYHKLDEPDGRPGYHSDFSSFFAFRKNEIDIALNHYGLENLNYHFANVDNPVSRRIVRALELYDSGRRFTDM